MTSSAMLAQLRAVLCDIERRVPSDDWVDVSITSVTVPTFENQQRARRRTLEGLGRLAEVVRLDSDFELDRDCRPVDMSALVRVDRAAAAAFSVPHPSIEADQAVLVSTVTKMFVYLNGRYAYTGVQPSSLFPGFAGSGVLWQLEYWRSWPLADVLDISDHVLEDEPGLAVLWSEKNAKPRIDSSEPGVPEPPPVVAARGDELLGLRRRFDFRARASLGPSGPSHRIGRARFPRAASGGRGGPIRCFARISTGTRFDPALSGARLLRARGSGVFRPGD